MKLSECTYGVIVSTKASDPKDRKIGMVVGITENPSKEPIPLVKWSSGGGVTQAIHHSNLNLYED